ncbi:unnamed protein product [Rodentolepis nana]|uniref:IRS-type PTB domain-containing protein n=1 Tax=Rodentolepis nana TaxID=102285 RepID=A0A0R3T2P9_RODNA|nr:unnamed protein product [Rodentolepis nana]
MSSKRSKSKSKKDSEEPEICLFKIPISKPKAYKKKAELKDFKSDKDMDIKVFNNGIQFFPLGKKKPKTTIEYAMLDDIRKVDGSPELLRLMTKTKDKKICYQITVTDEVNRNKFYEYLDDKKSRAKSRDTETAKESPLPSTTVPEDTEDKNEKTLVTEVTHKTYEDPPIKSPALTPSEYSRNPNSGKNYDYGPYIQSDYGNQYPKQGSIIRQGGMNGRNSEAAFDRKRRSTMFNVEHADDDLNSFNDRQPRAMRGGYPPWGPPSSYHSRSRISEEPDYIDDDYQDNYSTDYDYDYSEDSRETVVVRPTKPRSLTFYTPFLKIPQSRVPFYS